ncbi:hypothetical protein L7F22_041852 [Adiantum nelumboides]|nr:hypothetical protein [Adiantum nelumboides]
MADADNSLYVQKTEAEIVIITIYVDDLIIGGDAVKDVEHVKAPLCKRFDMKDFGELCYFLGIEMIRNEGGIWMSQKKYVLDILMKYGMANCKPISTPLDQNLKLRIDEGEELDDATMYCKIVGSFIYMTISRPDLSYAVGLVSQFMQLPRKQHLDSVRCILSSDHRSTCGYMFSSGSVAITWSSKKQPTVALLSTEAEYKGAVVAAYEVA